MTKIFTFWPVGQGLFYTGIIDDFTMVYDVGTANNQEFLDKQIEIFGRRLEHCHGDKVIDVLFLSHYDKDHISGLAKLNKEKFQIKKIIAPFITPVVKLFYLLELLQDDIDNVEEYDLKKVITAYSTDTSIVFVHPINDEINLNDVSTEKDIVSLGTNNNASNNELTGIVTAKYKENWRFKFIAQTYQTPGNLEWLKKIALHIEKEFNLEMSHQSDDIDKIATNLFEFISSLLDENNMNAVKKLITEINLIYKSMIEKKKQLIKHGNQLIKQEKKAVSPLEKQKLITEGNDLLQKGRNMSIQANVISLILYHEPIREHCNLYLSNFKCSINNYHYWISDYINLFNRNNRFLDMNTRVIKSRSGQLLTGDSVFAEEHQKNQKNVYLKIAETWDNFEKIFLNTKNIGVSLLPHHGSKFGWVDTFLNHTGTFIVSYGLGNPHKHPHSVVTDSILMTRKHNKQLIEVNQNENSILNIFVD